MKDSIQTGSCAFRLLQNLADSGAVKYRDLKLLPQLADEVKKYPGRNKSLFEATVTRLKLYGHIQVFCKQEEPRLTDRYVAVTPKGLRALEAAEKRKEKKIAQLQQFIKMNNAHSPINL